MAAKQPKDLPEKKRPAPTNIVAKEDHLVELLGHCGRWQWLVFVTMGLMKFFYGWVVLGILFLTPSVKYKCVDLPNSSEELKENTCYKGCLKYEYDNSPFENTIVAEWNLICERRWLASFTQTVLMFGVLIGSITCGYFSDRYGRRMPYLIYSLIVVVIGLITPFSTNYAIFTILRMIHGIAVAGATIIGFVIIMESIGTKYRDAAGCLSKIPFILGQMTMSPIAYFFRTWRSFLLALGIPPLICLVCFYTLTESPRWLVARGEMDKAVMVVTQLAKMNNRPTDQVQETLNRMARDINKDASGPKKNLNYFALLRKSLVLKTTCSMFVWLVCGMTYYGINQYINQTSTNPFISVVVAGIIQILANMSSVYLIKTLGRRLTISLFYFLCGIFITILYMVPQIFTIKLAFSALGLSSVFIAGTTIYVFTSELFPTVVRNMAMGAGSMFMRVGAMLSPFISNSVQDVTWLPTAMFAGTAAAAGLVCLVLPETKGTTLTDNIAE